MTKAVVLTVEEARLVRRLLDRVARDPVNDLPTADPPKPSQSADVYIAKVPTGGISKLDDQDNSDPEDDVPGSAECDIFTIGGDEDNPLMSPVTGYSHPVYNLSSKEVLKGYSVVIRDKYGRFVVPEDAHIFIFGELDGALAPGESATLNVQGGGTETVYGYLMEDDAEDIPAETKIGAIWCKKINQWIAIIPGEPGEPGEMSGILFTLTEDMEYDSLLDRWRAEADVDDYWGQDPGESLIVIDKQGLFARALDGAKGIAIHDQVDDEYRVVECESKAGVIKFTLNANMTAGSAAATVSSYWGSQQDHQDPGSTITVYDVNNNFRRALNGAKGVAVYNENNDHYNIVSCQQKAGWAVVISSGATAPSRYGGTELDLQDPSAVTLSDPLGLIPTLPDCAGSATLDVFAIYDNDEDEYVVSAVEPYGLSQTINMVANDFLSTRNLTFYRGMLVCNEAGPAVDYVEIEVVTSIDYSDPCDPTYTTEMIKIPGFLLGASGAFFVYGNGGENVQPEMSGEDSNVDDSSAVNLT